MSDTTALLQVVKPRVQWSRIGLYALVASVALYLLISVLEAYVRAYARVEAYFFLTLAADLRFLFAQGLYAATIFFVGAKFFETRTVFTIAFDRLDAARMQVKGPDENHIVWIGQRYATQLEAEAVAAVMAERLKSSA